MNHSNQPQGEQPSAIVDEKGPWPVVTRRVFHLADGRKQVWSSRHHRKSLLIRAAIEAEGIALTLLRCLWMPGRLNWWIGAIFALGSLFFAWASVLFLAPTLAKAFSLDTAGVNAIYFTGSIPFTIAAYLQLFQAANAGDFQYDGTRSPRRTMLFWLATPRHRLAKLCTTVRGNDFVQLQYLRRNDPLAHVVSRRPCDLGTQHIRLHSFPSVRLHGLHRIMSCPLGLETNEHFLVAGVQ